MTTQAIMNTNEKANERNGTIITCKFLLIKTEEVLRTAVAILILLKMQRTINRYSAPINHNT